MKHSHFRPKEEDVHRQVCEYIDIQYNSVIYLSDASGVRMPIGLSKKCARLRCKNYKIPDLIILEPRFGYKALIIEIKRDHDELYDKKGNVRNIEHLQKQKESLQYLSSKGYYAVFGCGFDDCKWMIDEYMKLPLGSKE